MNDLLEGVGLRDEVNPPFRKLRLPISSLSYSEYRGGENLISGKGRHLLGRVRPFIPGITRSVKRSSVSHPPTGSPKRLLLPKPRRLGTLLRQNLPGEVPHPFVVFDEGHLPRLVLFPSALTLGLGFCAGRQVDFEGAPYP